MCHINPHFHGLNTSKEMRRARLVRRGKGLRAGLCFARRPQGLRSRKSLWIRLVRLQGRALSLLPAFTGGQAGPFRPEGTPHGPQDRICSRCGYGRFAVCPSVQGQPPFAPPCCPRGCNLALLAMCQHGLCPQVNPLGPFTLPCPLGGWCACHSLALAEQLFWGTAVSLSQSTLALV